jgi:hypothetical protein
MVKKKAVVKKKETKKVQIEEESNKENDVESTEALSLSIEGDRFHNVSGDYVWFIQKNNECATLIMSEVEKYDKTKGICFF